MRIGVEATKLLQERRGIGRYVRNILRHIAVERPDVHFVLFIRRDGDAGPLHTQLRTFDSRLADRCTFVPISALNATTVDVVWYPWNWLHPEPQHAAAVTTICDLVPMMQLDHRWWKVVKRWKYRRRFMRTVQRSDVVIAISAFTAQEIERCLSYPASRVAVTLLAADDLSLGHPTRGFSGSANTAAPAHIATPEPTPTAPPAATSTPEPEPPHEHSETLHRLGINGPFFMAVGAHEARKNLQVLFRAMALLHARGVTAPLVLCGPGGALATIAKRVKAPWLKFAGFVPDAELGTMYRRATALVFPSRYEGFGLPALEAMAAGGRVICADESSLPEVVGDAALRFPWDDAEALATHMQRLLNDADLRHSLVHAGLAQAARFTWRQSAIETMSAFERAVNSSPLTRNR